MRTPLSLLFQENFRIPLPLLKSFPDDLYIYNIRCDVCAHLTNILYILSENALKSWFYGKQVVNVNPCSRCTNFTSIFLVPNYSLHQLCWEMTHWEIISVVDTFSFLSKISGFRYLHLMQILFKNIFGDNWNQSL